MGVSRKKLNEPSGLEANAANAWTPAKASLLLLGSSCLVSLLLLVEIAFFRPDEHRGERTHVPWAPGPGPVCSLAEMSE